MRMAVPGTRGGSEPRIVPAHPLFRQGFLAKFAVFPPLCRLSLSTDTRPLAKSQQIHWPPRTHQPISRRTDVEEGGLFEPEVPPMLPPPTASRCRARSTPQPKPGKLEVGLILQILIGLFLPVLTGLRPRVLAGRWPRIVCGLLIVLAVILSTSDAHAQATGDSLYDPATKVRQASGFNLDHPADAQVGTIRSRPVPLDGESQAWLPRSLAPAPAHDVLRAPSRRLPSNHHPLGSPTAAIDDPTSIVIENESMTIDPHGGPITNTSPVTSTRRHPRPDGRLARTPPMPVLDGYQALHHPRREPATIERARANPRWKTPYAYGYFGAPGGRHWSVHHGYRDRTTQWWYR